jgi:hypothetical protein
MRIRRLEWTGGREEGLGRRFELLLARLETPPAVGLALALVALVLITVYAEPYGRLWGTAQDARSYWEPSLLDPYANAEWTTPAAYPYSPVFLQMLEPIRWLPWQAFVAVWTAVLLGCVRFLTGPRLFAAGIVFASLELVGGNISLLIAVAIVLGFRFSATWALPLLTKVTPGVGLLWFGARREWRSLGIAAIATAGIVALSFVELPQAWARWPEVLAEISTRGGTWAAIPIPLVARLPVAAAIIVWAARTDRPWLVPVGTMLALPALWYGGLSILLAVVTLWGLSGEAAAARNPFGDRGPGRGLDFKPDPA